MSRLASIVSAVPLTLLLAATGQAGTVIHVDDDNCPGPGDGSEPNPYCSIQTAIENAVNTDEIVVSPGTYFESIDFLGKSITLRSSDGPDVTIVDGTGALHVVQCVNDEGPDTVLDGFTITGGNANAITPPDYAGGGMNIVRSSPTVTNCTFTGNSVNYGFGGMTNVGGSPALANCTFITNRAASGGGMYNEDGNPTVTNCTFVGDPDAGGVVGGGMLNVDSSPTLINCTFTDNRGLVYGGAMYNTNSSVTLIGCVFGGNWIGDWGGAIYSIDSDLLAIDCTFDGNTAPMGGAMMHKNGVLVALDCTITGNIGGGIVSVNSDVALTNCIFDSNNGIGMTNYSNNDVAMTVTACTFSRNTNAGLQSEGAGGAMILDSTFSGNLRRGLRIKGGNTVVRDCTISNNTAVTGGGMRIEFGSAVTVVDCRFVANVAYTDGGGATGGGVFNVSNDAVFVNCLFEGNTSNGWGGAFGNYAACRLTGCTFIANTTSWHGGAIYNNSCSPELANCTFTENVAGIEGGGMYTFGYSAVSRPVITNSTFVANSAASGAALAFDSVVQSLPSELTMSNCVLWNGGEEIWSNDASTVNVSYSNLQDGWQGTGNINADPLFVDPDNGNFRLSPGSPCIDAGHNNAIADLTDIDLDGNPRFADDPATDDTGCGVPVVVDMGAYEYQGNAAAVVFADLNGDGFVGVADLMILNQCMGSGDPGCCVADLDLDGEANVLDAWLLIQNLFHSTPLGP